MLLITHISIALLSVSYTFYTYFFPSKRKLKNSSWLVGMTLATGTVLVVSAQSGLVQACMMGLLFTGFSLAGIIATQHKLTTVTEKLPREQ